MGLPLDNNGFVPSLKNVPGTLVSAIESLRVDPIELSHPVRQVPVNGLDKQMIMVIHQAVGMTEPIESRHHLLKDGEKLFPVFLLCIDRFSGISPGGHVIDRSGKLYS